VYVFAVGQVGALSLFDGIWIYFAVSLEEKVRKFVVFTFIQSPNVDVSSW
jgi:hypothetical protein